LIGFAVGLCFLGGFVALSSIGGVQKRSAVPARPAPLAGEKAAPVGEESAESDNGAKVAEKKVVPSAQPLREAVSATAAEPRAKSLKTGRSVAPGGYRAGQALDVIVSLQYEGGEKVTALALVERLPKGWIFQELSGGEKPVILPAKGATGDLTFVWVQVPAFPCTVSYRIVAGPEVTGPQEIEGQAVYREFGPEQRTAALKTVVSPAAP
jgi:hypothetical protein